MSARKARIGFILASIHTGTGISMWKPLVREASHSDAAFYIFPGGRLNGPGDSEYLRNSIYRLANRQNLDGLISWGSTLGGFVSVQELNSFHNKFADFPYVTIAHKMPGHPCVKFDAYNGMADLVRHFLKKHGTSRIAFLRGPEAHSSSMERYRAFCDVMASDGHDMRKSPLVSDPFPWSEGAAAMEQLYQQRGLRPGRDFEVLLGASDMMTFSAVRYLEKMGYRVPEDYKCAGFNDSVESRIAGAAFTTVHMPYSELALTAFDMAKEAVSGKSCTRDDIILPSDVVVRESCGCPAAGTDAFSTSSPSSPKELTSALAELLRLDETSTNAIIEPIVNVLMENDEKLLLFLLAKALERFFLQDMDLRLLFKAFSLVKASSFLPVGAISAYENRFLHLVAQTQNRVIQESGFREQGIQNELNLLKCELLEARSREVLLEILSRHLPKLEINSAALVFTESDSSSLFAGGFADGKLDLKSRRFSSSLILPEDVPGFDAGVFLVQPLFLEKQPIGHLICSVPSVSYKSAFFEELRSAISSALSGIFRFEEATLAMQKAEKAEQAKTNFFANVGSDLCDPLIEINRKIDQLEKLLYDGCTDSDILLAQMIFLKNRITEQKEKTDLVLQLTLSQANELPFDKMLFHPELVFPEVFLKSSAEESRRLPLLYGDPERLRQAVTLMGNRWQVPADGYLISEEPYGLSIKLEGKSKIKKSCWNESSMILAERILMLLGAALEKTDRGCVMTCPWPAFNCHPGEKGTEPVDWNEEEKKPEEWAEIYSERNDSNFQRRPFLFRTNISQDELKAVKTFTALFERRMSSAVKNPVLFIGTGFVRYSSWVTEEQSVILADMSSFRETIERTAPSLVVMDSLNTDAVNEIRQNPVTVLCPVFVLPETIKDEDSVSELMRIPRVILANRCIAQSEEFAVRARAVIAGEEVLPPDTGALVKKAICYLNVNAGVLISRWKLADYVHVSEDYLTRIFHKETGLSPWEYLNRYRIFLAAKMLLHTNSTVYEVAEKCGFQDQAYFCRVFKKIHGVPPGKYRSRPDKQ